MKKVLIIIGVIFCLPLFAFAIYALEDVYYNIMGFKVENAALKYLEKQYGQQFKIDDVQYSKILGEDEGSYQVEARSLDKPEITFLLDANENYEITSDDFKENKWGNETRQEYLKMAEPFFKHPGQLYAFGSFPEEIAEKYDINDTYQSIYQDHPLKAHEYIHIVMFPASFNKEVELEKLYQFWQIVNSRALDTYRMEVEYYPEKLLKTFEKYGDRHQFDNDYYQESLYNCRLSENDLALNPQDIANFCHEIK
ncbi:hypothetical protein [Neobacillus sp. Marseille-QA0830]